MLRWSTATTMRDKAVSKGASALLEEWEIEDEQIYKDTKQNCIAQQIK